MLAPKSLSSPQNAAITAGGTPNSFSARANAAACVLIFVCPCCIRYTARHPRRELREHLPEHALAAVAVDDALIVDQPRRCFRQRPLRHPGGDRLLLEVGEEAVERHAAMARRAAARGGAAATPGRVAGDAGGLAGAAPAWPVRRSAGRVGAGWAGAIALRHHHQHDRA